MYNKYFRLNKNDSADSAENGADMPIEIRHLEDSEDMMFIPPLFSSLIGETNLTRHTFLWTNCVVLLFMCFSLQWLWGAAEQVQESERHHRPQPAEWSSEAEGCWTVQHLWWPHSAWPGPDQGEAARSEVNKIEGRKQPPSECREHGVHFRVSQSGLAWAVLEFLNVKLLRSGWLNGALLHRQHPGSLSSLSSARSSVRLAV